MTQMVKSYRVFVGAPTVQDISQDPRPYRWQTVTTSKPLFYNIPPATLEAASRRISLLYQNIIFRESEENTGEETDQAELSNGAERTGFPDNTTLVSWPPTANDVAESQAGPDGRVSFLRTTASTSRIRSQLGTQETQETGSYNYSDASSIARFPAFHFNLHSLTSLSNLISQVQGYNGPTVQKGSRKITVLAAVLEMEGPDTIRIKKGADAGKEVSLLKIIVGDEGGAVCKLTAWRETAESWGGADPEVAVSLKRGDVVLFGNVLASWMVGPGSDLNSDVPLTLTASSNLKSMIEICYRTMPYMPEDSRFRPDLRLGFSDAAVRKVAAVVKWFEDISGLSET